MNNWKACPLCGDELHSAESDDMIHPESDSCPLDRLYLEARHMSGWNLRSPAPVEAEGVNEAIRKATGAGMLMERRRWWQPEYPGQIEPERVAWYRDDPETGLSGFDTEADRDAFRAGGNGPFIRRVTGNEYPQMPVAALRAQSAPVGGEVKG